MTIDMITPVPLLEELSVQDKPKEYEGHLTVGGFWYRGPILQPWGTRQRERQLRQFWHHDYNTIFRGGVSGLVKRVQSTPWEVRSDDGFTDRWQGLLMNADFGDMDRFLSKLIIDYSRHDQGAFVEIIAPGDPREAPIGPPMGVAVLDSVRCCPTGIAEYPVLYLNRKGTLHLLHRSRVVQFIDSPDTEEDMAGYGDCALSRSIAAVMREIRTGQYVEAFLDDKPPPGIAVFGNISKPDAENEIERRLAQKERDEGDGWGHIMRLYALQAETAPQVTFTSFQQAPEKFDYEKYKTINVREIALALGLDIQDLWELTSSGLGTGTQSEILAQKSRGKGYGRILKGLERVFNRILPDAAEFSFEYKDPQEDLEEANKAQVWVNITQMAASQISIEEQRQLLAQQVPAFKELLVDDKGNVVSRPDDDPKEDETVLDDTADAIAIQPEAQPKAKAFSNTATKFEREFGQVVRLGDRPSATRAIIRSSFRTTLYDNGVAAYDDGLRDGGVNPAEMDAEALDNRRKYVASWVAAQSDYINKVVKDIMGGNIGHADIVRRSKSWINKSLRTIYYTGYAEATADEMVLWQLGKTEKHCSTCLALNGQIHKRKDYLAAGFVPGSSELECKGYNCDCKLVPQPAGTKARGKLPTHRVRRNPNIVDKLMGFVRRIFGRG